MTEVSRTYTLDRRTLKRIKIWANIVSVRSTLSYILYSRFQQFNNYLILKPESDHEEFFFTKEALQSVQDILFWFGITKEHSIMVLTYWKGLVYQETESHIVTFVMCLSDCPRSFLRSLRPQRGRKICPFPQCIPQNLAISDPKF